MALSSSTATDGATATSTPALNEQDNFFARKPTDFTYTNSYTISYSPSSSITDHKLVFDLPKLASPNVAFLNEVTLHLMLKLQDKDAKKPDDGENVAPVNLFTSQMFRSCRLYIQDVEVSSDNGFYGTRSYVNFLTSRSFSSKNGSCQINGFYLDRANEAQEFDASANGFLLRQLLFGELKASSSEDLQEEGADTGDGGGGSGAGTGIQVSYYDRAMPFFAKVLTDWSTCSLPLIPDCSIRLEFELADPSYYMCTRENVEKKFRLKIEEASLLLPVRSLSTGNFFFNLVGNFFKITIYVCINQV